MKKTSLFSFDLILLISTLTLIVIGILFIYSSGLTSTGILYSNEYIKQIVWASTGILLMLGIIFINYTRIKYLTIYFYGFIILLLLVTLLIGREVHGAKSWLGTGDIGIQPSEFAKIITILFLALYLSGIKKSIRELPRFLLAFGIILLPMGLILLQPDMGTALVYFPIFLVMTYIAGAQFRHIFYMTAVCIMTILFGIIPFFETIILGREISVLTLITNSEFLKYFFAALLVITMLAAWGYWGFKRNYFYWIFYFSSLLLFSFLGAQVVSRVLKEYQVMRLIVFMDPSVDPKGSGWNIIQSVTAVGSGGFAGKGFKQGTQSHFQFLPQQSTDFIFSILAEEWGFLGCLLVFVLFILVLVRGIRIMYTAQDDYGRFTAAGIVGMIFFHIVVNIGMAIGIMPITGIPLFFLSYGGSSLWTALISIGFLLNIYLQRYRHWG